MSETGVFCGLCGVNNQSNARFCKACGKELKRTKHETGEIIIPSVTTPPATSIKNDHLNGTTQPVRPNPPQPSPRMKLGLAIAAGICVCLGVFLIVLVSRNHSSQEPAFAALPQTEPSLAALDHTPKPEEIAVTFSDNTFEKLIRQHLNKPYEDITKADLLGIYSLHILGDFATATAYDYYIGGDNDNRKNGNFTMNGVRYSRGTLTNLDDIVHLENLHDLSVCCTSLRDISALSALTQLETLRLTSNVFLSDISVLSSLTNLSGELALWRNNISDLSPLSSMQNIDKLGVSSNNISDISPLENLTNWRSLNLYKNSVADLVSVK